MSYGIYIGANHSSDGHGWLAGYGDEPSSHWLELAESKTHGDEARITVGMTPEAGMPGQLSQIPQASQTARLLRVNYSAYLGAPAPLTNGGLNEHGVAVRDIWSPSRTDLAKLTPTDQTGPNYSDLARIVLERAHSAREGVDIIESLIAQYGYSTYGGNSHIIADAQEAWIVIEFAGGLGLWVAERLGPDSIRASRPGYIGQIPLEANEDFRFPAHFITTAVKHGWRDRKSATFNVNEVYGDGKGPWKGAAWVETEMRTRAAKSGKIGLSDVIWAISNQTLTGDTAGYGQVVPLHTPADNSLRLMWHAPVGAVTAPLVPVFLGQNYIPLEYGPHRYLTSNESGRFLDSTNRPLPPHQISNVSQAQEVTRSAFQIQKRLMHLAFRSGADAVDEVSEFWRAMEKRLASELPDVLDTAEILFEAGRPDLARQGLTNFSATNLLIALQDAEILCASYEIGLRNSGGLCGDGSPSVPEQIW